jgi:NADH-quinone oxidoreductase subunit M
LATFSCTEPWGIIVLLALATLPPYFELRQRRSASRVYVVHMTLFVSMMVLGWTCVELEGEQRIHGLWATAPIIIAVFVRSGVVPLHCWIPDLFDHVSFGTAILFVTPISGAYLAARLMLPIAPDWGLSTMGALGLVTAIYAAGIALVQTEARRLSCYLFLSHSALVLVGLELATPLGVTGALCMWLSVAVAMGGFGLTLRSLEARRGRLSLARFQGLYEHTPNLAMCFLLTGLASIGFPGTFGFVGSELLVDSVVEAYPYIGVTVVLAAALNGTAVVRAYFLLFTGTRYVSSISLQLRARERYAVLTLAALILVGGLVPQSGVRSRYRAADELLRERTQVPGPPLTYVNRGFPTNLRAPSPQDD